MNFVSSNSPAETNMKIHFVLNKICTVYARPDNIFSDISKCAKTTKEMEYVGSMTNVPITMRRILTKKSTSNNLSKKTWKRNGCNDGWNEPAETKIISNGKLNIVTEPEYRKYEQDQCPRSGSLFKTIFI